MTRRHGVDLDDYMTRHGTGRVGNGPDGPSLRVTETTARARLEQEAASTGLLAVLICWVPYANIFTLVAGAARWSESRRSFGGHNGAFATLFSITALITWTAIILYAT